MEEEAKVKYSRKWFLASFAIILIILAGVWFILNRYASSPPIPKSISKQLKITLYYPYGLPSAYTIDENSFSSAEGQALAFNILSSQGKSIAVTEQALPSKLDLYAPDPGNVKPENFNTPVGEAAIRSAGANRIGYINTGKTLLIFNLGDTPATDFQAIAKDFKKL